jgi:hypothetical protein
VFEAKARRMSVARTMDELDRALANREAQAAIAVFDEAANAPTCVPFTYFDNAIFVLDDGPDERLIELAYIWARIQARQSGSGADDGLDPIRVGEAIADISGPSIRHRSSAAACPPPVTGCARPASTLTPWTWTSPMLWPG